MRRLLPYAQLVRLPNVFTALADIALGALAAGAFPVQWLSFLMLALASGCLYSSGMVWNDYFDIEQDRKERPFRPLPSGRVSRFTAMILGISLMAAGIGFAVLGGFQKGGEWRAIPALVALFLTGAILLYDGVLKRIWLAPVVMGLCRSLNVLLGLSTADDLTQPWGYHLALVVGVYIAGLTWFARSEARQSSQSVLRNASLVMMLGLLLALPLPDYESRRLAANGWPVLLPYLLVLFGLFVGIPVVTAIGRPTPAHVQAAVKRAIVGLVVLDAILAVALAGPAGFVILLLLVPTMTLGRWVYST